MEKIDWTKPIEDMDGKSCLVVEIEKGSPHFPAQVLFPNGAIIWLDEYGCWDNYQVRNVVDRVAPETATLRDQFAMAALTGLLAHASGEDPRKAPAEAYKLADAMLATRKKGS